MDGLAYMQSTENRSYFLNVSIWCLRLDFQVVAR